MPPSVASAPGSTGKKSPYSPAARSSAVRVTPAWTVALRSSGAISTIRFSRERSRLMPPRVGITWPSRLEPAPNGVTATLRSLAIAMTRETSSVEDG